MFRPLCASRKTQRRVLLVCPNQKENWFYQISFWIIKGRTCVNVHVCCRSQEGSKTTHDLFFFGFWVRFERAPSLVSFVVVGGKTTRPTDTKEGEKDPSLGIHPLRPWTTIIKPRMTDARRRKVFMEYSLESTQDTHRQIWSLNTKRHCVWNREE